MTAAEKTTQEDNVANALAFSSVIPQSFIDQYIKRPGEFIVPSAAARAAAIDVVGKTYDAANITDKFGLYDDWSAVLKSGFDPNEQLWELISFRNEPVLSYSTDTMKQLSQLLESVSVEPDSEEEYSGSDIEDDQSIGETLDEEDEKEEDSDKDSDEQVSAGSPLEEDLLSSDIASSSEEEEEDNQTKRSIVDDDFFSLAEMEKFADEAEEEDLRDRAILAGDYPKNAANDDEESEDSDEDDEANVDMFQDLTALDDVDSGDEDDMDVDDTNRPEEMMYADFFKAPKGSKRGMAKASREKHAKRVKFDPNSVRDSGDDSQDSEAQEDANALPQKTDLFGDDSEDDNDGAEAKSQFEKRQEKLQGLITKLEDEAVDSKHWTMTGEVTSSARPKDSLLGESLEFDYVQKPVPVVTQEATQTIEDMIKRRILNEEWDDVERKKDIQVKPFRPSGFIELNDKASKKSLAEEYEDQYMAQKSGDQFVPEKDVKLAELHKDIKGQMHSLFTQLDALSHFHYAPKPATVDIEIRTNAPALTMEEKLPVNVSHAEQFAPEEVYEKNKGYKGRTGDLKGDTELSREDRKRQRQRKKEMYKKKTAAIAGEKKASKPAATQAITAKAAKETSA
ncbi:U3 snoRNP protein [Coemansia sp. RSA 1813]|nr:U3 snoRNP protein [Coemansia sp. RSA 1843]KAJ2087872.1 U3 snoRNP protein [Coemansia sp. RSA 986]KAJ2212765.1 U3 snoRNP protein [Coemansia sp. RSA 487]KAJ2567504.1 U3 snoRNP protein [Coemansia sp. RSA 1813]